MSNQDAPAVDSGIGRSGLSADPPAVVYVVGTGRCGSTLLGNLLNAVPGCIHIGEVTNIWRFIREGPEAPLCGCSAEVAQCPLWTPVLDIVARGRELHDLARQAEVWRQSLRLRHTWRLLRSFRQVDSDPVARYADLLVALYRAVSAVTGATLIIDSSKRSAEAAIIPQLDGVKGYVVHMVRNPVGYAHSIATPTSDGVYAGPVSSVVWWYGLNYASRAVTRRFPESSLTLRYEDFVARPDESLDSILRLARGGRTDEPVTSGDLELGTNHGVGGNVVRFERGRVAIELDSRWQREMPAARARFVRVATRPLAAKFGY